VTLSVEAFLQAVREAKWVSLTSVLVEGRDLHLGFHLWQSDLKSPAPWDVSCVGVPEFSLNDFEGGGLNWWPRDHPVIAQYSSPKASLRIRLTGRSRELIVGILLAAHTEAVDDWISFDRFVDVADMCRNNAAAVTISAPEFLLSTYLAALDKANVSATLKRHKRKLYWSRFGWSERPYILSLLHFGDSFVAAERFIARRSEFDDDA